MNALGQPFVCLIAMLLAFNAVIIIGVNLRVLYTYCRRRMIKKKRMKEIAQRKAQREAAEKYKTVEAKVKGQQPQADSGEKKTVEAKFKSKQPQSDKVNLKLAHVDENLPVPVTESYQKTEQILLKPNEDSFLVDNPWLKDMISEEEEKQATKLIKTNQQRPQSVPRLFNPKIPTAEEMENMESFLSSFKSDDSILPDGQAPIPVNWRELGMDDPSRNIPLNRNQT